MRGDYSQHCEFLSLAQMIFLTLVNGSIFQLSWETPEVKANMDSTFSWY